MIFNYTPAQRSRQSTTCTTQVSNINEYACIYAANPKML